MLCTKMDCSCLRKRKTSTTSLPGDTVSAEELKKEIQKSLRKTILVRSAGSLLFCMLMAFILIWVIIPVSFMLSLPFQTFAVFIPIDSPRNANFDRPQDFGMEGVYNFYITTTDYHNPNKLVNIGAWLVLPEGEINSGNSSIAELIRNTKYDILIYLHGVFANRAKATEQYKVLRKHFLIIAIDHRGYGDSGLNVPMTEIGIAHDHRQIYSTIRSMNPTNDLYYWGHSLGTGMTTRTLRLLKELKQETPKGVVLESPFTSFEDIVVNIVFGRIFGWLAYFDSTILNPLDKNGFHFRSYLNVLSVDCPLMILHAEDDNVVPFKLGKRLAELAQMNRRSDQGSVTFYGFSAEYGFMHNDITKYQGMGELINGFKDNCRNFSVAQRHKKVSSNFML